MAAHAKFISRTVMVQSGNVDAAYKLLNRILTHDRVLEDARRRRYFEKPCRQRQRKSFEACKRIYDTDMARRLAFVSRKSGFDPWVGC
ncbi:small ribosomal subunit protein bS21m [Lampetra fluviatilis]